MTQQSTVEERLSDEIIKELAELAPFEIGAHKCEGWNDDDTLDYDTGYIVLTPIRDYVIRKLQLAEQKAGEGERKAFGKCTKCYGKGYSTQMYGEQGFDDFVEGEGYRIAPSVHMNFCNCERGGQLKNLLSDLTEDK